MGGRVEDWRRCSAGSAYPLLPYGPKNRPSPFSASVKGDVHPPISKSPVVAEPAGREIHERGAKRTDVRHCRIVTIESGRCRRLHRVWSGSSAVVVVQHAAKTLTPSDGARSSKVASFRANDPVAQTLVIALCVIVGYELGDDFSR